MPRAMGDFPKPGPEHQRLHALTGVWKTRTKEYFLPGEPPRESMGEFLARMDLGGYFLCREVNYGLQGFQGRGVTGYDAQRGLYVGTWVDSTSPWIHHTEGHFDEGGNYCERSRGVDHDGSILRMRLETERAGPDDMVFRMYCVAADGVETLAVEIEQTRRRFVR